MIKDNNAYYEDLTSYMENYEEYKISELAEKIAVAIQRRTGERIKDWTGTFKIISDVAEYVYITDENEIEKNLINKFNSYDIHLKLNEIDLEEVVWEALGY